jgi:hypothetical protein
MIATGAVSPIHTDAQGRAWIDDTNVKVIEVVKDWLAHGSSPEGRFPICGPSAETIQSRHERDGSGNSDARDLAR